MKAIELTKIALVAAVLCFQANGLRAFAEEAAVSKPVTVSLGGYFRDVGKFKCKYNPGVFLVLRNGRILALCGELSDANETIKAEDGKTYCHDIGMTELYDPATGETKLLTRMPFHSGGEEPRSHERQMQAVELKDGRVLLVGEFKESVRPLNYPEKTVILPRESERTPYPGWPKVPLESIAPRTEPQLFGIIYDWRTNEFETVKTSDDIPPRHSVKLHVLSDGRVLVLGGAISKDRQWSWMTFPEKRVLVFDPETKTLSVAGELQKPRYGHEIVPVGDDKFLLLGGFGRSPKEFVDFGISDRTKEVELFDLASGGSKLVGMLLSERSDFSAVLLPTGNIFISGGPSNYGIRYTDWTGELFHPKDGKSSMTGWGAKSKDGNETPLMPIDGMDSRSILIGSTVLSAGWTAFKFEIEELENELLPSGRRKGLLELIMPRVNHELVRDQRGRVYVMGGLSVCHVREGETPPKADIIEEFTVEPTASTMVPKVKLLSAYGWEFFGLTREELSEAVDQLNRATSPRFDIYRLNTDGTVLSSGRAGRSCFFEYSNGKIRGVKKSDSLFEKKQFRGWMASREQALTLALSDISSEIERARLRIRNILRRGCPSGTNFSMKEHIESERAILRYSYKNRAVVYRELGLEGLSDEDYDEASKLDDESEFYRRFLK